MNNHITPFQELTRLNEDNCAITLKNRTTSKPGNYRIFQPTKCDKKLINTAMKVSLNQPQILHKDGYGVSGCYIDIDSKLRNASSLTNMKVINQLYERPYLTTPYMGRGIGNICEETMMNPGESTMQKKQCNNLSGIYTDRFIPQIPCIERNTQNNIHIIPEDNDNTWVRGGQDSRQLVRNEEYLTKCGYKYNNKFWSK